jgi:plasmid stabilization system protein ParE
MPARHPLAAQDIAEIWEYIAEDDPLAARRVREEILNRSPPWSHFPIGATNARTSLHGLSASFWCVNI